MSADVQKSRNYFKSNGHASHPSNGVNITAQNKSSRKFSSKAEARRAVSNQIDLEIMHAL